jgi:hypothetical protein
MVRDPAGARELTNATAGRAGDAAETSLRETFAALDSGTATGTPTWTHASAHQAEAGFEDPALGWIGVRADRTAGGVHAALVPGSAEAAQELGTHMDGLNTYLTEQHTPVDSLAMAAPEARGTHHSAEQNPGDGMNQGAGQGTGQGANQGTGQNAPHQTYTEPESVSSVRMPGTDRAASVGSSVQSAAQSLPAHLQTGAGVHISVVA